MPSPAEKPSPSRTPKLGLSTAMAIALSMALASMLVLSAIYLSRAPTLGFGAAWDDAAHIWKVASVAPGSPLREGDSIDRIGGVDVGFLELLTDNASLESHDQIAPWFAARETMARTLAAETVAIEVHRGGLPVVAVVSPRPAGVAFLSHAPSMHIVVGLAYFLIGILVFTRGARTEESRVFFALCMSMTLVYITNGTSLLAEVVYEPWYLRLMNRLNMANFFFAPALLFHFSLLLPKKRALLERFPAITSGFYAACVLVVVTNPVRVVNVAVPLLFLGSIVASVQGYVANRKEPIARQQMKWVAAAFLFSVLPWVLINGVPLVVWGKRLMDDTIPGSFLVFFPIFLAFAIQKYRLLDIDALFAGTFVYALTLARLGVVDVGLIALFGSSFGQSLSLDPTGRAVLRVAATVSLYAPVRDQVRQLLRRLFRRQKDDGVKAMTALIDHASGAHPRRILEVFEETVRDALGPTKIVWIDEPALATFEAFDLAREPVSLWEHPALAAGLGASDLYVALPVRSGGRVQAALALGELPKRRFYSREDLASLAGLLKQATILYDNAQLFEENARHEKKGLEREKRHLAERESILRELHDGLGSITTGIVMLADAGQHAGSTEEVREALGTIRELSRESLAEIRGFMQHLDIESRDWPGLASELRRLGARVIAPHGLEFELDAQVRDPLDGPGNLVSFHLFRILNEAFANIVKHARATRVLVALVVEGDAVRLCVTDDGVGLVNERDGGHGVHNMQRRAELLGGSLTFRSANGTGTVIDVVLSLAAAANATG